jgi:hypothetical protein
LTGQIFLAAVALGSAGGLYLAFTTSLGRAFAFGTAMLNAAWIVTRGMTHYAIRHRLIAVHREWMIRAYVVTFVFVSIRLFNDVLPTSQLAGFGSHSELGIVGNTPLSRRVDPSD